MTIEEKRAEQAFKVFCGYFDGRNLKYTTEKTETGYKINISGKGDDLNMSFGIYFNAKYQLISVLSQMPFNVEKDRIADGAVACAIITDNLREGSFDFNLDSGAIFFRITSSFMGMDVSKDLCAHLFEISTYTVDRYNDKLFMLAKGAYSTSELYKFVKG